jgi:hypothetical protein
MVKRREEISELRGNCCLIREKKIRRLAEKKIQSPPTSLSLAAELWPRIKVETRYFRPTCTSTWKSLGD